MTEAQARDAEQVLDLERQWWRAFQEHDGATSAALSDEPSVVAGAMGIRAFSRASLRTLVEAFDGKLERFELRSPEVRFIHPDVAVVTYSIREELTVASGPVVIEAADSSTWVRREGEWRCAVHSESLLGDPYGRDRNPAPTSKSGPVAG